MQYRAIICCVVSSIAISGIAYWSWNKPHPNLLIITLDTTRADHLGCYGYKSAATPCIDDLAASGTLCEHAYSVAPLTLPAHASMLTGLYPAEVGLITNGRGKLSRDVETLSEVLREHGYATGAFVSSFVLDSRFGLDQGFDVYDDDLSGEGATFTGAHRRRPGKSVIDQAIAWLSTIGAKPSFCWVHLYDPHAPYADHSDSFGDQYTESPYDAEIAYTDAQIGRLLKYLKSRGLDKNTAIVVVADHGEGLSDHNESTHGCTLYNSIMRVPLILNLPRRVPSGHRIQSNVSLVDLYPTILDLLGIRSRTDISGKNFLQRNQTEQNSGSVCFSATDEPNLRNHWSSLRSVIDGNWKYIHTSKAELYDLSADPDELENLVESQPERAEAMKQQVIAFEDRLKRREEDKVKLRSTERRALQSLGYTGTSRPVPRVTSADDLPDIKDMLIFDCAVEEAIRMKNQGLTDAAIRRLRDVVRQAPSHSMAHLYLGDLLCAKSELDEATEVYQSLLAIKPDAPGAHYALAYILASRGLQDEAIAEYKREIEINPDAVDARCNLAKLLAAKGDIQATLAEFIAALDSDPWNADVYHARANALVIFHQPTEAIEDLRQAIKLAPNQSAFHRDLGELLADQGDFKGALRHLTRAVELNSSDADGHYLLGSLLLHIRRSEEAVEHLQRAIELRPGFYAAEKRLADAKSTLRLP